MVIPLVIWQFANGKITMLLIGKSAISWAIFQFAETVGLPGRVSQEQRFLNDRIINQQTPGLQRFALHHLHPVTISSEFHSLFEARWSRCEVSKLQQLQHWSVCTQFCWKNTISCKGWIPFFLLGNELSWQWTVMAGWCCLSKPFTKVAPKQWTKVYPVDLNHQSTFHHAEKSLLQSHPLTLW